MYSFLLNKKCIFNKITEIVIYFIAIFSTWAFGTTEQWSIWTVNCSCYLLGVLVLLKTIKCKFYNIRHTKFSTFLIGVILFTLLAYIFTSAVNARGSFNYVTHEYKYFTNYKNTLPHSYDENKTWNIFWQYLGLMILFFSTRN